MTARDAEFELKIGVVSHPVAYEEAKVRAPHFEVDPDREYPLRVYRGRLEEHAGTCRVRRKGDGFAVTPSISLRFAPKVSTFYGAFVADESGRAPLQEVLLVIRHS